MEEDFGRSRIMSRGFLTEGSKSKLNILLLEVVTFNSEQWPDMHS